MRTAHRLAIAPLSAEFSRVRDVLRYVWFQLPADYRAGAEDNVEAIRLCITEDRLLHIGVAPDVDEYIQQLRKDMGDTRALRYLDKYIELK